MKKRWIVFIFVLIAALVAVFFCTKAFFDYCIDKYLEDGDGIGTEDIGESIVQSLTDKDSESLKAMFSDYVKDRHNLDEEIDIAFSVFDEEIVSSGPVFSGSSQKSWREGKVVFEDIAGDVSVTTGDGKKYIIAFNYIITSSKDNIVGLKRVSIFRKPPEDDYDIRDQLICIIGHEGNIPWGDTD